MCLPWTRTASTHEATCAALTAKALQTALRALSTRSSQDYPAVGFVTIGLQCHPWPSLPLRLHTLAARGSDPATETTGSSCRAGPDSIPIYEDQIRRSSCMSRLSFSGSGVATTRPHRMTTHFPVSGLGDAIFIANPWKCSPMAWSRAFTPIGLT